MTKVVLGMSMSLDGIAGPESADADGMAIFMAILGWQFPLRSWREQQSDRDHPWRGSGPPPLRNRVKRPKRAFPRKRLVKSCTKRFRGNRVP